MNPVAPRLLTMKDTAVYLGRSLQAIKHLTNQGKLPTVRFPKERRVFYDVKDLDKIIQEAKHG